MIVEAEFEGVMLDRRVLHHPTEQSDLAKDYNEHAAAYTRHTVTVKDDGSHTGQLVLDDATPLYVTGDKNSSFIYIGCHKISHQAWERIKGIIEG